MQGILARFPKIFKNIFHQIIFGICMFSISFITLVKVAPLKQSLRQSQSPLPRKMEYNLHDQSLMNARPQDNLYLAVNSKWLEHTEIPSDRSRISSFDGIDLNIEKELMSDFADFADGKKEIPFTNSSHSQKLHSLLLINIKQLLSIRTFISC